jgi:hypothetical protein
MELVLIFAFAAIAGNETPENIGPFTENKAAIIEFMLKNELIDEHEKKNFYNDYKYEMTHNTITMPYGDWLYIFALRNVSQTLVEYSRYNIGPTDELDKWNYTKEYLEQQLNFGTDFEIKLKDNLPILWQPQYAPVIRDQMMEVRRRVSLYNDLLNAKKWQKENPARARKQLLDLRKKMLPEDFLSYQLPIVVPVEYFTELR